MPTITLTEILAQPFTHNALAAALLVSIACGLIGTLVVVNRLVLLSGGIAHTAYGGVGLAFFAGWPVVPTTLGFTAVAALALGLLTRRRRERADAVIGALWSAGMAFGIILINLTPGYATDLMSYLFGSILTVSSTDLGYMAALNVLMLATVLALYRPIFAMSFDEDFARSRGVATDTLYLVLLVLVALSVVVLIQVVGLILVIALLTIPPATAEKHTRSLHTMMAAAMAWGALYCGVGLWLSFAYDLNSGASIVAAASIGYLLVSAGERLLRRSEAAEAATA
jgi:zinc transport system permease protein